MSFWIRVPLPAPEGPEMISGRRSWGAVVGIRMLWIWEVDDVQEAMSSTTRGFWLDDNLGRVVVEYAQETMYVCIPTSGCGLKEVHGAELKCMSDNSEATV